MELSHDERRHVVRLLEIREEVERKAFGWKETDAENVVLVARILAQTSAIADTMLVNGVAQ